MAVTLNENSDTLRDSIFFFVYLGCVVAGISATANLGYMDSGDFSRVISFMLSAPEGVVRYQPGGPWSPLWEFREVWDSPFSVPTISGLYFYVLGAGQAFFSDVYDLRTLGAALLLVVALVLFFVARTMIVRFGVSRAVAYPALLLYFSVFIIPYNAAFFHSFYQEQTFIFFLPIFLLGMLRLNSRAGKLMILFSLFFMSASKSQFFYFPLLLAGCYVVARRFQSFGPSRTFLLGLLAVQLASLPLLLMNPYKDVNYYHSLYFGSYLLMSEHELAKLGNVRGDCVGVDRWGWQYDVQTAEVTRSGKECFRPNEHALKDVLAPWLTTPDLLLRVWQPPVSEHTTVGYFHVLPDNYFAVPPADAKYETGQTSRAVSELRDRMFSRVLWLSLPVGIALLLLGRWYSRLIELQLTTAFFGLASFSQYYVSVLGEGLRDLSKHLAGAQILFDLMAVSVCVLAVVYVIEGVSHLRVASNTGVADASR